MPREHGVARMLPDVTMTARDGRVVNPGDYRHRKHLVLVLLPDTPVPSGATVLQSLSARYAEFVLENAEVLAVLPAFPPDSPPPDRYPFPVLEDRDGALSGALSEQRAPGIPRPTVYVADRYGEIFRSFCVTAGKPFPLEELLSCIRFLERLCPE
ncbi:MAG TPA: redoxin domain-containing protein [Candidatus Deferrimicrobiaceae bacterium]